MRVNTLLKTNTWSRKGFQDFALYLDTFVVKEFHSKWPLDKETTFVNQKMIRDYEKT